MFSAGRLSSALRTRLALIYTAIFSMSRFHSTSYLALSAKAVSHLLFDLLLCLSASDQFHLICCFGMLLPLQSDGVTAQCSSITLHMAT